MDANSVQSENNLCTDENEKSLKNGLSMGFLRYKEKEKYRCTSLFLGAGDRT